ncbi:general amidase [Pterulicium gracile]|uniref:amidase n=1 Tax=Pterulicium gracile TaxID=1884261 RepID=A0A5C3QGV5_9AGAR|nr:general amidase [Pterula gracilis]
MASPAPAPRPTITATASTWQSLAADKRARQAASIPREWILPIHRLPGPKVNEVIGFPEDEKCGLLTTGDLEVTNASIEELLANLTSGTWTAVGVVKAFAKRAIIAHQLTNCLTEIFIEQAITRAAELDAYYDKYGKPVGPLHGLPFSLKDQITVKGLETTMGYVSWIGEYATENALVVDIMIEAGAVPYVRTNVPQTLMWPESFNNIFGRTSNPYNRTLTSGGSSGGEGALIALKGSPLGIGSDIGGSVRIPANFCGIYSLRPSAHRVPYLGAKNSLIGQDSVPSVLGPMSSSISGLKIFFQTILASEPWFRDASCIRKPWSEEEYKLTEHHNKGRVLSFGIMWDDGIVKPHPPVLRALEKVKRALVKKRHKVVEFKAVKHAEICMVAAKIWDAGALQDYTTTTSITGEPIITTMSPTPFAPSTSGAPFRPGSTPSSTVSAYDYWQLNTAKQALRQEYLSAWQATSTTSGTGRPFDAILCPAASWAAPPHGKNTSVQYTMVWNVLDYPVVVLPVTRVDQRLDVRRERSEFLGAMDREVYESYDPKMHEGSPVGIQVVGRNLEDEAVLALAEIVDEALKADA